MARIRYNRDPRWLYVKYTTICARCEQPIKKGAEAFYYPSANRFYCADDKCGTAYEADFESAAEDEEYYNEFANQARFGSAWD